MIHLPDNANLQLPKTWFWKRGVKKRGSIPLLFFRSDPGERGTAFSDRAYHPICVDPGRVLRDGALGGAALCGGIACLTGRGNECLLLARRSSQLVQQGG